MKLDMITKLEYTARDESGFTLLEVIFASAIMVIIGLAYMGSLSQSVSVSQLYSEQNQANILIGREIETLKNTPFDQIPFRQTSETDKITDVPDYYDNIAIGDLDPTQPGFVDTTSEETGWEASYVFDGKRAGEPGWKRWKSVDNGPIVGGGFIPQTDDPIIVPNPDEPDEPIIINPRDYEIEREINDKSHFVYVAFPRMMKIHRIIYDNRFNVSGDTNLDTTDIDYKNHRDNVWQRDYQIFVSSEEDITKGLPFQPRIHQSQIIYNGQGLGYGSTGVLEMYNNIDTPLEATVLGVGNISVETDFDPTYHYPYASELEAYSYKPATWYVDRFQFPNGEVNLGNYIMCMPKYLGSNFDLFRRVYLIEGEGPFPPTVEKQGIFHVQIDIYPHDERRNKNEFIRTEWWQSDDKEIMSFSTSFSRNTDVIFDNLPGLQDLPQHTYYFNDEDINIPYIVPGASKMRAHFQFFSLQVYPDTDYIQFFDKSGNQYGDEQYYGRAMSPVNPTDPMLTGGFSPWIDGDTMVLHFISDDYLSSIPNGNMGGFKVDYVEID